MIRREKIAFLSGGDTCAGYLLMPKAAADSGRRWPAVVLAHGISVAADDPGIAAILWDALHGKLGLSPAYIPMIGRPGELAVVSTTEARRHLRTLAGAAAPTRWRNQVGPRGLLQMQRYRPALDAARLRAPLLVCLAIDDTETPEATARELADRARRGTVRRYPGTHSDFYADPSVRDRALADQLSFLREHLHASPRAA